MDQMSRQHGGGKERVRRRTSLLQSGEEPREEPRSASRGLPTDAASDLDVFHHDSDTLGMDCSDVAVLKEVDQVGLKRLLEGDHGVGASECRLETCPCSPCRWQARE